MDKKLYNQAVDALLAYMAEKGAGIFEPPTIEYSSADERYVYLGNAVNEFPKYNIATGRIVPSPEQD